MADLNIKVVHQLPLEVARARLRALIPDLKKALEGDPNDPVKVEASFGENAGSFKRIGLGGDITLLQDAVLVTATFTDIARARYDNNQLSKLAEQLDRGIRDRLRVALAAPAAPPAPPPEAPPPVPTPGPLPQAPPVDSSPTNSEPRPAPRPRKAKAKMPGEDPEYVNFSDAEADPIVGDVPRDGDPGFIGPPGGLAMGPREGEPGFTGPPRDAAAGFIGPPDLRSPEEIAAANQAAADYPTLPDIEIDDTGGSGDYSALTSDSPEAIDKALKEQDDITPDNAEVSVGKASSAQGNKYNPGANVGPIGGKKAATDESDAAGVLGKVLPQAVKSLGDLGVAAINRQQPQRSPIPAPGPYYALDPQQYRADLQRQQQLAEQQRQLAEQQRQFAELRRQQQRAQDQGDPGAAAEAARLLAQAQRPSQAAPPQPNPPPQPAQSPLLVETTYASPAAAKPPAGGSAGLVVASVLGVVVLLGVGGAAAYASKKRY